MVPRRFRAFVVLFGALLLLLTGSSCIGYASAGRLNSTVAIGGATTVSASIKLNHGRVAVRGGASGLMLGTFATDDKNDPAVSYAVQQQHGTLSITQTSTRSGFSMMPTDTSWTVDLNDDIPLDLSVDSGEARTVLNLDTLTVTRLALTTDDGNASISLDGVQRQLTDVSLHTTSGSIELDMHGRYQKPRQLDATTASGNLTINLGGAKGAGLTGSLRSASGAITLVVPKESPVEISVSTDSGTIHAAGLTEQSPGVFVTTPATTSQPAVRLEIHSTSGAITLKLAG